MSMLDDVRFCSILNTLRFTELHYILRVFRLDTSGTEVILRDRLRSVFINPPTTFNLSEFTSLIFAVYLIRSPQTDSIGFSMLQQLQQFYPHLCFDEQPNQAVIQPRLASSTFPMIMDNSNNGQENHQSNVIVNPRTSQMQIYSNENTNIGQQNHESNATVNPRTSQMQIYSNGNINIGQQNHVSNAAVNPRTSQMQIYSNENTNIGQQNHESNTTVNPRTSQMQIYSNGNINIGQQNHESNATVNPGTSQMQVYSNESTDIDQQNHESNATDKSDTRLKRIYVPFDYRAIHLMTEENKINNPSNTLQSSEYSAIKMAERSNPKSRFRFPANIDEFFHYYKLPFYDVIKDFQKSVPLFGEEKVNKEVQIPILLSADEVRLIKNNSFSSGKNIEYIYQIQLRICLLGDNPTLIDSWPADLSVCIDDLEFKLLPTVSGVARSNRRRILSPLNCTPFIKLRSDIVNRFFINWTPNGFRYAAKLRFVKKLSPDVLVKRLYDMDMFEPEKTKMMIIKMITAARSDSATITYHISLNCPISKKRFETPVKSINCDHLSCFDAKAFLIMNETNAKWICPICSKSCLYEELKIDEYFLDIIECPNLFINSEKIELLSDGLWKNFTKNITKSFDIKNEYLVVKNISDIEISTVSKKSTLKSSQSFQHSKMSCSNLTLTNDKEDKYRNKAQATISTKVYPENSSKPQAQINPPQTVTNSNAEELILNCDSLPSTSSGPSKMP